ncbi:flagellar basal body-associated FliL family protein [Sulfitobacter sp.]|jgi:flagellar FliL protein|uniref:flagellar basal body-associated FliL family protein n=1 Tax=Sulfitobacter sp. TaxID=1903071 RepID=UPI0030010CBC
MKKLLPLVLLLIGVGAGVGAGVFLRPAPDIKTASASEEEQAGDHVEDTKDDEGHDDEHANGEGESEYVKLSNQFVVPIVLDEKVSALVVLALSIEVPAGKTDTVYLREPKLRDSFLQVLFDHANVGGFEGNFTDALMLDRLRTALREVAQKDLGKDVGKDVLIIEIARQDY